LTRSPGGHDRRGPSGCRRRLDPDDPAVIDEIDRRLMVQQQIVALERTAQARQEARQASPEIDPACSRPAGNRTRISQPRPGPEITFTCPS
jgi:hypothetical protein